MSIDLLQPVTCPLALIALTQTRYNPGFKETGTE
jgi:hypothetical protein